jgi:hypothetical protein
MFALPRTLAATLFAGPVIALAVLPAGSSCADGPKDNIVENVRPVPPAGNDIPDEDRTEIKRGLAELQQRIKDIGKHTLLPDVLIYEKAVRWALDYNEIYDGKGAKPAANVKKVLAAGLERARQLKDGKSPWATQTGGVVRGYKSKIDGSVQPYWIIVPKDYDFAAKTKHRLDFWWHGRGETLSEANFMANSPGAGSGIIPAPGALILHPYGRYCNANKFAGEIDTFECLGHAKEHYRIDEDRLVARGFSMGGAACWQYGVHYPSMWAACAPGAGFSETPEFLKVFQKEDVVPMWYEQKLWHLYNATDSAQNLFNLPTVAYSGEIDSQKQAADVMAREMKKVGLDLKHIIGPKTAHAYEKGAKEEVNKLIDALVEKGRDPWPAEVKFVTYTMRYDRSAWVQIMLLDKHWERAEVHGTYKDGKFDVKTKGVWSLAIYLHPKSLNTVVIDGQTVLENFPGGANARMHVDKVNGKWEQDPQPDLRKWHGQQGPIDDAFMDHFVFVRPTGKPISAAAWKWVDREMKHAIEHWRKQFRGDVEIMDDTEVLKGERSRANLILWGDSKSNAVLAKIADKMPIRWTDKGLVVGKDTYDADKCVPAFIYPRLTGDSTYYKYVVINSGFTFREYDYLNNARQVPKLPDYAVFDITTPTTSRTPAQVIRAGFFNEKWELQDNDGK